MKSYSNLWEKFISKNNIKLAIHNGVKGKGKRKRVKKILDRIDSYADEIYDYVMHYYNHKHSKIKIIEGSGGKEREIIVPRMDEHIVHHMIIQTIMPLLTKGMYKHTYSSIPGRGMHQCRKKIESWITNDPDNCKYCMKLDIRKFFDSIDHHILKNRFAKYIKDKAMLWIIEQVIDAIDKGLPLGFFTSHWFANWLLQPLDHLIKENMHIKHYARYMDDMVLFSSNKDDLKKALKAIRKWLKEHNLTLKSNWQIFRFDYITKKGKHKGRELDFIGFKYYCNKVILRKKLMLKLTRKAKKIEKKGKFTIHDARQLMSQFGLVDWADVYQVYKKYVAPYITIKACKERISKYDKQLAQAQLLLN